MKRVFLWSILWCLGCSDDVAHPFDLREVRYGLTVDIGQNPGGAWIVVGDDQSYAEAGVSILAFPDVELPQDVTVVYENDGQTRVRTIQAVDRDTACFWCFPGFADRPIPTTDRKLVVADPDPFAVFRPVTSGAWVSSSPDAFEFPASSGAVSLVGVRQGLFGETELGYLRDIALDQGLSLLETWDFQLRTTKQITVEVLGAAGGMSTEVVLTHRGWVSPAFDPVLTAHGFSSGIPVRVFDLEGVSDLLGQFAYVAGQQNGQGFVVAPKVASAQQTVRIPAPYTWTEIIDDGGETVISWAPGDADAVVTWFTDNDHPRAWGVLAPNGAGKLRTANLTRFGAVKPTTTIARSIDLHAGSYESFYTDHELFNVRNYLAGATTISQSLR
ncbi:MAG: hypothetical protein R3E66_18195 [bacterium]